MPRVSKERKAYCRERLLELLQPGDKVQGIVTHVSKSGMSRSIDFAVYRSEPGEERNPSRVWLTPFVADLLELSWNDDGAKVSGCGMDMVFATVYNLSRTLWPKGYGCTGKDCRSNDHSNGDRNHTPHTEAAPHWHTDGGYALKETS